MVNGQIYSQDTIEHFLKYVRVAVRLLKRTATSKDVQTGILGSGRFIDLLRNSQEAREAFDRRVRIIQPQGTIFTTDDLIRNVHQELVRATSIHFRTASIKRELPDVSDNLDYIGDDMTIYSEHQEHQLSAEEIMQQAFAPQQITETEEVKVPIKEEDNYRLPPPLIVFEISNRPGN